MTLNWVWIINIIINVVIKIYSSLLFCDIVEDISLSGGGAYNEISILPLLEYSNMVYIWSEEILLFLVHSWLTGFILNMDQTFYIINHFS